ncbi:MAG: holo-ACP synthase [Halanaerobiales bacterium]
MIKGVGLDIVKIERIENLLSRWEGRFLNRVYTEKEIEYCRKKAYPASHYAARFAAKEAIYKALGGHPGALIWKEIEVTKKRSGEPEINLSGKTEESAQKLGIISLHISLTHARDIAAAQVVGEGE